MDVYGIIHETGWACLLPLLLGWTLDKCLGDPPRMPHPVVYFGRYIGAMERRMNKGRHRRAKGVFLAASSTVAVFTLTWAAGIALKRLGQSWPEGISLSVYLLFQAVLIFYCLCGTTLAREVRLVFQASDRSVDEGRRQVARIVGRDTSQLSRNEVRTAALETLAENLSDGVVAPLFWLYLLGLPGMMAYKMINTMDSMVGYRTERYAAFGWAAARLDDVANYIPARLTALLIALAARLSRYHRRTARSFWEELRFIRRYGRQHLSPNSGYPEAALAGLLDCRFGGTHAYFGQDVPKPYIGHHDRPLQTADLQISLSIAGWVELLMIAIGGILAFL